MPKMTVAQKREFLVEMCNCREYLKTDVELNKAVLKKHLVRMLKTCKAPLIPVPHTIGAVAFTSKDYPKTIRWIRKTLKCGEISLDAYKLIKRELFLKRNK